MSESKDRIVELLSGSMKNENFGINSNTWVPEERWGVDVELRVEQYEVRVLDLPHKTLLNQKPTT